MRILEEPLRERELIETIINQYGYTPDHNFDWLMYCADEGQPQVALWEDGAIWFYKNSEKGQCTIVSDPIAPAKVHVQVLSDLVKNIFSSGINKILFLDVRIGVHDFCKTETIGEYKFYYDIDWPIVSMDAFNPKLPGGKLKDLRRVLSKFNREHRVEIKPTELLDKKELHGIVDRWFDNRTKVGIEELYPVRYHKMIDGDFHGVKSSRVMIVDGKPVGFNGGWETPNNKDEWSASIGLHDFSIKDLGVALMMEDLEWIKNAGYKTCDLEGSDPPAIHFKTQFFPAGYKSYKTYTFWITKK